MMENLRANILSTVEVSQRVHQQLQSMIFCNNTENVFI